jgi:hypothetical protein
MTTGPMTTGPMRAGQDFAADPVRRLRLDATRKRWRRGW